MKYLPILTSVGGAIYTCVVQFRCSWGSKFVKMKRRSTRSVKIRKNRKHFFKKSEPNKVNEFLSEYRKMILLGTSLSGIDKATEEEANKKEDKETDEITEQSEEEINTDTKDKRKRWICVDGVETEDIDEEECKDEEKRCLESAERESAEKSREESENTDEENSEDEWEDMSEEVSEEDTSKEKSSTAMAREVTAVAKQANSVEEMEELTDCYSPKQSPGESGSEVTVRDFFILLFDLFCSVIVFSAGYIYCYLINNK